MLTVIRLTVCDQEVMNVSELGLEVYEDCAHLGDFSRVLPGCDKEAARCGNGVRVLAGVRCALRRQGQVDSVLLSLLIPLWALRGGLESSKCHTTTG